MRHFKIRNANGEIYDLTVKEKDFLHTVSGLGYKDSVEYRRVANLYKTLSDYKEQGIVSGKVHFFNDKTPHTRYFDFILFLQVKPLTLIYEPEELNKTFYRSGTVTNVEFSEDNPLSADITFTCTTLWYERVDVITRPDSEVVNGKIYTYKYNYVYRNSAANSVLIDVMSNETCPVKLSIYGELVNPEWVHYVNGVEVASGKVNYTIPSGNKLVIDTTNIPYSIKEYDDSDNFIIDLYDYSDFATKRFIKLGTGKNLIAVRDEENNKVVVKAEAMINYASV